MIVTSSGIAGTLAQLRKLADALSPDEILDEAQALILNRNRARFLDQVSPDGQKWKPSRRALRTGGATLFHTGKLFHSLQASVSGVNERTVGTDIPYAAPHQFGTGNMPARKFLGVSDNDLFVLERLVLARIQEAAK